MSDAQQLNQPDEADQDNGRGAERIADPDDYNTRRRLKQLHDAKELVKLEKNDAINDELRDPRKHDRQLHRRNVAEVLADYILELRPILQKLEMEEQFLQEEVEASSGIVKVEDFRKREWFDDQENAPTIRTSMYVWDVCNDYLERVAGAMFERNGLPSDNGFDATDETRGW